MYEIYIGWNDLNNSVIVRFNVNAYNVILSLYIFHRIVSTQYPCKCTESNVGKWKDKKQTEYTKPKLYKNAKKFTVYTNKKL